MNKISQWLETVLTYWADWHLKDLENGGYPRTSILHRLIHDGYTGNPQRRADHILVPHRSNIVRAIDGALTTALEPDELEAIALKYCLARDQNGKEITDYERARLMDTSESAFVSLLHSGKQRLKRDLMTPERRLI